MRLKLVPLSASLALAFSLRADAVCKFIGSDFDSAFLSPGALYPTPDPVTASFTLSDGALPNNSGPSTPISLGHPLQPAPQDLFYS
jgi:hypothetical protein